MPVVPPELLNAIVDEGKVVFVLGAGCSVEAPTNLPLSSAVAREAHRKLLTEEVLSAGDVADPDDLAELARAVGNANLVARLPVDRFRTAQANEGYLVLAALLRERAVAGVLTLNYDLAIQDAIVQLGGADISVLEGPDDVLRMVNVVYLHRSARRPAEEWILEPNSLVGEWEDVTWEKVVAARLLTSPFVLFAGLGSKAILLSVTIGKIRGGVASAAIYQIGPGAAAGSDFFADLDIPEDHYLSAGWCEFMRALGERVVREHCAQIVTRCDHLAHENGWTEEGSADLLQRVGGAGLVAMGRLRASWTLQETPYLPQAHTDLDQIATLVLAVRWIEELTETVATVLPEGIVEFWRGPVLSASVILLSGRGVRSWSALEVAVRNAGGARVGAYGRPTVAVVTGASSPAGETTLPVGLTRGSNGDDIIIPDLEPRLLELREVRADPKPLVSHFR